MDYTGKSSNYESIFPDPLAEQPKKLTKQYGLQYAKAIYSQWGGVEIDVPEALRISGNYRLDSGGETWAVIGVNHDRRESDPEPFSPSEWQAQLETNGWKSASVWEATESTVGNLVQRFERGQPHWQWMIAFALMALLLETLLLRPWKKTS